MPIKLLPYPMGHQRRVGPPQECPQTLAGNWLGGYDIAMPTLLHRLSAWADESPGAPAHRVRVSGQWREFTVREFRDRVYWLALFLESRGVSSRDIVAILAQNSPEWIQLELGMLLLGGKSAGIFPNSSQQDILYILNHTDAMVLGVQDRKCFERITQGDPSVLPRRIRLVIVFDGDTSISPKAVAIEQALEEGKRLAQEVGERRFADMLARLDPRAGAFLIFTSGTTGTPKGALLSQDNLVFAAEEIARFWKPPFGNGSTLSFLPLCHVAEKIQNVGVAIVQRYLVTFCARAENVAAELVEVQPTLLLAIPRLWGKMMEGVLDRIERAPPRDRKLGQWALAVGARVAEARFANRAPSPIDRIQYLLADRLVLAKIRAKLGLARAELLASGAAALPAHVSCWYRSIGCEILENYGQTESTGLICLTIPGMDCSGTVGVPVPGVEFKFAEDGEMLTRGRQVFLGYFRDVEATRATLVDGWLHTGDLGELDARGLVRISGRKKEVMKTSGGKMVAPLPIEERLKKFALISQVCMVGDGRKYLAALITLTERALEEFRELIHPARPTVDHPQVIARIRPHVDEVNKELASHSQIRRFTILARDLSVADGEMTPTLKMKRAVIAARFREIIEQMYR